MTTPTPNDLTLTRSLSLRAGTTVQLRPLAIDDGPRLGDYFATLSETTRRRFGPHPLEQATANRLCATIDHTDTIRFIATLSPHDQIIAYCILMLHVTEYEQARFAQQGLPLNSRVDCMLAPSVADAFQNQGLGVPLMNHVIDSARQLGRRYVVLSGGVQVTNERAVHVYQRLGFRPSGTFEYPGGCWNTDMLVELTS